jgi:hypothetical protein
MAPTPYYYTRIYYNTLRNELVREIIENTLKYQRRPIYRTGKDFNLNLKTLLSAVYMNDYDFLSNYKEERIKIALMLTEQANMFKPTVQNLLSEELSQNYINNFQIDLFNRYLKENGYEKKN